jgi:hypothetical protein
MTPRDDELLRAWVGSLADFELLSWIHGGAQTYAAHAAEGFRITFQCPIEDPSGAVVG